jgi:hypothetical protein
MIDLIVIGDNMDLVLVESEKSDLFNLDEVHILCDELESKEYGYGIHKEKNSFNRDPVLIGERILLIPAEIWIFRKNINQDSGIVWYHKDFDIKDYLLQEYEEKEAELLYYKIKDFNKYEELTLTES